MKKIIPLILAITLMNLLFGCKVYAQTQQAIDKFKEEFYTKYNTNISNENAERMLNEWQNGRYLYSAASSTHYKMVFSTRSDSLSGDTLGMYSGDILYDGTISTWQSSTSPNKTTLTGYIAASYMCFSWGLYEDFEQSLIDFENVYYNPQIPVPKLDVWYLYQVESYREDGVANFTANIDVPDSTEFYVELAWKYSYPQNIRVYSSDIKGTPAYDYELYKSSDLISVYTLQDMKESINLHVNGSDLQTKWQDAYDDFIDGVTFYTNQSNAPSNWLSTARLNYVNKMATQIPLYGNRLEIFARYWTLSEDNQVVVGKWYHWQSAKGSATEDVPENYVNYQELPGYAGTVENVPTGDESTYTGTGETTGEQATTIINYSPNYPDYPTAVSYNHDNILLQMIQTSKQLPQFFGQFTNFLAITLAFIDPGVWAIIGFGFTCCIVIMIIKVL